MKLNALPFYLWLFRSGFWGILLYRRYRHLPKPVLSILSKLGINPKNKYIPLYLEGYNHPIWARSHSSDIDVFYQIFIEEEYSGLEKSNDFQFILDCGANVGYSSIYLLNKYPNAHVIAVEPDEENFKVCQKNLASYSERVSLIRSAIWSREAGLVICQGGDGREWGIQVKECPDNQKPDLLATDILTLLENSGFKTIDLLKIDVEGAEVEIFSQNYQKWLGKVKNIVIELHDEKCEKTFLSALSEYKCDISKSGELTVCQRISAKQHQ